MRSLVLAMFVIGGLPPAGQAPPVFRAEAYTVANFIVLVHADKPIVGLTADDVSLKIDKRTLVAASLSESTERPGAYVVSFNPPDHLRDGKSHRIEIKVRMNGKWKTLPMNWRAVFEKPRDPSPEPRWVAEPFGGP
jgi:hypothetical protein